MRVRRVRGVRWRLLGPVRLLSDAGERTCGPGKQQAVLAVLLISPGQPVPVEVIVERVWGERPPRQANPVAAHVARLRRIAADQADAGLLRYAAGGYLFDGDPDSVDLHRARRLAGQAHAAQREGDDQQAADLLCEALSGWQSTALAGVPGDWAARIRDGLARERLDLLARRAEADLRLGRHAEVVEELRAVAREHPTEEGILVPLLTALTDGGHTAEALRCYAAAREAIAEELGAEPSPRLQQLHLRILRQQPPPSPEQPTPAAATATPARPVPAQLPTDTAGFTGRTDQLDRLDAPLTDAAPATVVTSAVSGTAGVDKTGDYGHRRGASVAGMLGMILERDGELAALGSAVRDACGGAGSVVLICGEAGIGKSRLVQAIPEVLPEEARLLVGYCDDLTTPRVFGPLRDLAGQIGPVLSRALERGDHGEVLDTVRDELGRATRPTVLVVEDVHWADEATLDVLRYLVRRAVGLPLVLVLTYRDEEVPVGHPLRQVLGLAAQAERVRRLGLTQLSRAAVVRLCAGSALDPDEVLAVTSGNPYFVTEVLATGDVETVPLTVTDAIQARLTSLDPAALRIVELLAVVPSAIQRWLVEALVLAGLAALAPGEQRGLLTVTPSRVSFRHELARRAVLDGTPVARQVAANRRVLAALLARPGVEASRVVHHAAQAGDRDLILEYGPVAAREASAAGAHREAAAHLRLVLDQQPNLEPPAEAELWQRLAIESYTTDAPAADGAAAQRRAVELRRGGDSRALGDSLRWLSRICWWAGDRDEAEAAAEEAITVLGPAGDDQLLAMALSGNAQLHALAGRDEQAIEFAERAIELGGDAPAVLSHALNNLGMALLGRGDHEGGWPALEESLRVALAADEIEHACRAYTNLIWNSVDHLRLDDARRYLADGIEMAERSGFLTFSRYMQALLGALHLATGDWDKVEPAAAYALDGAPPVRCSALTMVGRTRARRGDPDAIETVSEALRIAVPLRECRIGPVAAALAEAAVLNGNPHTADEVATEACDLATRFSTGPELAEVTYWRGRLGHPVDRPVVEISGPHPYALLADGRWEEAAQVWAAAGCPYEHAAALTNSSRTEDQLAALAVFDSLGAQPMARLVRAHLRNLGVTRIPLAPRPSTRRNTAGLTRRQVQIMALIATGLTSAEIANRLVLSVRTVDSHVAAALDKLDARTRREAVAHATTLGILAPLA